MSDNKKFDFPHEGDTSDNIDSYVAVSTSEISSAAESVRSTKTPQRSTSSSDRQIKFERAQKALENAALVSKRIKEHRKATAELLGRPFEEDDAGDTASEMASTMSERTGYSAVTDTSTTLSVKEALNIPGISESLANTLKQKELLMERIKQYKEISKRPSSIKSSSRKESITNIKTEVKKTSDNMDLTQLISTVKEKENMLSVMQVKMKAMETTILDLQEKLNEKDQIIEAKNMATTLMSDSLSKKDKDSMILLEDTRQQMTKMQENFVSMESEWKEEKQKLLKEIEVKDEKIKNLEEANTILENSRFEISLAHSKLAEELDLKNKEIQNLMASIDKLSQTKAETPSVKELEDVEEEKGSKEIASMVELTKKIELLEELNCQIRKTNKELENKLATTNENKSPGTGSPVKKGSPLPARKGKNVASKLKSPWSNLSSESTSQEADKKSNKNEITKLEMLVKSLNKEILEKEYVISQHLSLIDELRASNSEKEVTIQTLESVGKETKMNTVDVGVATESNIVSDELEAKSGEPDESLNILELNDKLKAAQEQIGLLNTDIDTANKNMIKVKSNHKLKIKQMQKTIDNFSKVSDANAEIVRLNEEVHQLSQKVAELEEEKGNLQLHLVDYDSSRLTDTEVYKKMVEMESLAETRLKAISTLESQKFDLVQELHELQQKYVEMEDKLADMSQYQNEQVCSEMKSVQLEEQIDELMASKKELELIIDNLKLDKDQLNGNIKRLQEEKEEIFHKLEHYIQENIDLTDKLEKLSAEKVSSAESIEIVESLTTQEKLELEEYNKGKGNEPLDDEFKQSIEDSDGHKTIQNLMEQSVDLNKKIELFTQERQEVMEKMTIIQTENEELLGKIEELNNNCSAMQANIELLNNEKYELHTLNNTLNQQIEELKRERLDIMKEAVEVSKPSVIEESTETVSDLPQDEKLSGDKGSKTKSVKQLTKEILKLKNTIKEREAEIADCQMKILSLEENQEKQNEILQAKSSYEAKINILTDENQQLKEKLDQKDKDSDTQNEYLHLKNSYDDLQTELQKVHSEYASALSVRDARVNELENLLLEYEKQVFNYNNTLQQKDKELTEYINQITKLNDVSQKLKSTIEILEEEKHNDPNAELVKTLNKQIAAYQKKLSENEDKLRILEDEKVQLLSLKGALETKNNNLDIELKKMQDTLIEKQALIKELQAQQKKYSEEVSSVMLEAKERDEEIHEIKLQLRKESIENEKLRTILSQKEKDIEDLILENEVEKKRIEEQRVILSERDQLKEQFEVVEAKNKELLEKLKKFAVNIKKKSTMYTELENQLNDTQKQLEIKNDQIEQFLIQISTLPSLQEKVKLAEEEINRLQSLKISLEQQKSQDVVQMQAQLKDLEEKLAVTLDKMSELNDALTTSHRELHFVQEENTNLKTQVDALQNKIVEHEIEQKNNFNLITKISSFESDLNKKQQEINELLSRIEIQEQQLFGHAAKVQERDLYIETLEAEINKHKNHICRLEEVISAMEDRRHSLERKADQLDSQLQEKQKAYSEYSSQEDQLVSRLAVLMDHDRVVEKQLYEIESDNKELQYKIQHLNEENQRLKKALSDIQEHCNTIEEKASKTDAYEAEIIKYQTHVHNLESNLKKLTQDYQTLLVQRKQEIEELETEFNTQIEDAIKEKKSLSEKYEKISEHVTSLEQKLQEYRKKIEDLCLNIEELNKINQDLIEKSAKKGDVVSPDYTEQYINEINNLNALLNRRNDEIYELNNKILELQNNNISVVSSLENKISDLASKNEAFCIELNDIKQSNEQLQKHIVQKEEIIKEMKDKKRVSFEMNIPKTEGMVISSTIEALSDEEPKICDMSSLESQIVSNVDPQMESKNSAMKISEYFQTASTSKPDDFEKSIEPPIVPKKSYLCYKGQDESSVVVADPFNSDEGWGFGDSEDSEVVPGMSHLNEQVLQLKKENQALQGDLEANNVKLLKALKKLKELKASNDSLTKELKLSKEISQSSFLDSAIEDELRLNIQGLEKKIEELQADLMKEKKEKEAVKKQNEVFNNANDKFVEMKEKMDNEVELWKYKFKEVNDKLSSMQWGSKDTPEHKPSTVHSSVPDNVSKEEITKLERENDELQQLVEQLASKNKELSIKQDKMTNKFNNLQSQIQQKSCESCENLNKLISELHSNNRELLNNNEQLKQNLNALEMRFNELVANNDKLKSSKDEMQAAFEKDLNEKSVEYSQLQIDLQSATVSESEAKNKIVELLSQMEDLKSKLNEEFNKTKLQGSDSLLWSEKCDALQEQIMVSQQDKQRVEKNNQELLDKCDFYTEQIRKYEEQCKDFENKIHELNIKISENIDNDVNSDEIIKLKAKVQQLNTENDELLSTVTELRSSIASAVDQRGFEISELWKQHLAQREADFQKTEQELRSELNAAESKYEQLLDSVQSSSQEETNKLIMIEQVNALQTKLKDKEEHLINLQDKYAEVMNQLDMQRSELEDEKIMHDNKLITQQDEYEKLMHELRVKHQQSVEEYEESSKNLQSELTATKDQNDLLNQKLEDAINKMMDLENRITDLDNDIKLKDSEIYRKTLEYTHNLSQRNEEFENVRKQLIEYEKKVEDITYEKESELAILRLKIHENTEHYEGNKNELEAEKDSLNEALNAKIVECTNLNKYITELKQALEEHSNNTAEMQLALESQEVEIVTLNDEIANLQKMISVSAGKIEKHVTFSSDTKPDSESESPETLNKELLDAVPRAELDLALYMLHQRDVRCEELTMELTQLLEERDTLQLRLSDSLRSNEELKLRCKTAGIDDSFDSSQETVTELPSISVDKEQQFVDIHRGQTSRSSSISDPDGDKPKLQAKLSELRSVKHSRDVRLRQESEQRQLGLRLMQRDVALLPPEARDQLAQAHHTLSRDSQSTSTVLLNWLRGKSTPKVVHM
ncbi:myosin-2 heavy chain-like [Plodia interpunctella]|uniref:myosin-2 heavy chain-like n=1 Tax=Plodia interpunctella TaxID=58824 RepID=UPI002367647E|nr:myosin-2 heavy chain-like [Plodia interpunctella]